MKKFKKILTLIVIITVVAIFAAGCSKKTDNGCELVVSSGTATLTVTQEGKNNKVFTCATTGGTLEEILNEIVEKTDFTFDYDTYPTGIFITKICDIESSFSEETWFAIYIGEEMSVQGASELNIEDGIIYKIVLVKGW
ncbi:MAG: DUF4430 domain-containing protein [Firmicutes bacterium]|nr:DUF4430 domain-containing protein [Bacillota bacterium]